MECGGGGWHCSEIDKIVPPQINCVGEAYHFHMLGKYGGLLWFRKIGFISIAIGAALLLIDSISFLRRNAIGTTPP